MQAAKRIPLILAILLGAAGAAGDVTDPTPYDYERPPAPGRERGTYMAAATGVLGPECFFSFIGTAKLLPNPDGTGGWHCAKGGIEVSGPGPLCALKPLIESTPFVIGGTYTYNGDGTLCESLRVIGGPLDGRQIPFHTYVDPNGKWVWVTLQDIAYGCVAPAPGPGSTSAGPGFKIGAAGDDPPGSGALPCTNP